MHGFLIRLAWWWGSVLKALWHAGRCGASSLDGRHCGVGGEEGVILPFTFAS